MAATCSSAVRALADFRKPQGIWNADLKPAWYSGYTCKITLRSNYWPAELTGSPSVMSRFQ